jgi:hypothetical protein
MERRIKQKVGEYFRQYKDAIKEKVMALDHDRNELMELVQFVYDYEEIVVDKEDFTKRKRTKNMVPLHERCVALRANGEQCTRRKRIECEFCGTHVKGSPNGTCDSLENTVVKTKIDIWSHEIKGILYYIDGDGNVYDMNDIMRNEKSPKIIMRYEKDAHGTYQLLR